MRDFFDSVPDNSPDCFLCFYANATSQTQITLIRNNDHSSRQRVVFPGQCLRFEAATSNLFVILTSERNTAILSDVIPCQQLRVTDVSVSTKSIPSTISSR